MAVLDELEDGVVLLVRRPIDLVVHIVADARQVRRDVDDFQLVDLRELTGLGHGGAGHAGELRVKPEVVLEGDRGQGLVLVLDIEGFLRLERLVQALRIAPAFHHAAGEFVDDHDAAVLDDVIGVAGEQLVGAQRLVGVVNQRDVGEIVQIARAQQTRFAQHVFKVLGAGLGEGDRADLLVLFEILVRELGDQLVDRFVKVRRILGLARDDQGRARLVDEDRIDLVDDRVIEGPLDHVFEAELHVVAQIIEAELVVGTVGDVGGVSVAAFVVGQPVDDASRAEAEKPVDLAHPLDVALREVVVHRDHMHAGAVEGVEIDRQGRDQGLALAGLHLGDLAAMEDDSAEDLDVEVALAEGALGGLAHGGEGFHQDFVQGLAGLEALAEPRRAPAERIVAQHLECGLERVGRFDVRAQGLEVALVGGAEHAPGDGAYHEWPSDDGAKGPRFAPIPIVSRVFQEIERAPRSVNEAAGPGARGGRPASAPGPAGDHRAVVGGLRPLGDGGFAPPRPRTAPSAAPLCAPET